MYSCFCIKEYNSVQKCFLHWNDQISVYIAFRVYKIEGHTHTHAELCLAKLLNGLHVFIQSVAWVNDYPPTIVCSSGTLCGHLLFRILVECIFYYFMIWQIYSQKTRQSSKMRICQTVKIMRQKREWTERYSFENSYRCQGKATLLCQHTHWKIFVLHKSSCSKRKSHKTKHRN